MHRGNAYGIISEELLHRALTTHMIILYFKIGFILLAIGIAIVFVVIVVASAAAEPTAHTAIGHIIPENVRIIKTGKRRGN